MFKREHHNQVATILESLNSRLLSKCKCYFGGGTAIALLLDEYRESVDMGFLCSSKEGYRELRSVVKEGGLTALFNKPVSVVREARVDRYGVRGVVEVSGTPIKFEIVSEGRLDLSDDGPTICGVKVLGRVDMFAEKMLANSDRWGDKRTFGRDIIDINAMVTAWGKIPDAAKIKANGAYGKDDIERAIEKAIQLLQNNPEYAKRCAEALGIHPEDAKMQIPAYRKRPSFGMR